MLAQEGERWIVTLAGYFGDYPPTDEQGFLEFARSLPVPDVYEVIRTATPLSDPIPFRFPANQRRHYEKLTRFPDGTRKVTQISEVAGMESEVITLTDIYIFQQNGTDADGRPVGQFRPTGLRPMFAPKLEAAGFKLDRSMFMAAR